MKSVVSVRSMVQKLSGLSWRVLALAVLLGALLLAQSGCKASQPGETADEVNRRHKRTLRVNSQQWHADIDRALHLDRPSHLTDRRLP